MTGDGPGDGAVSRGRTKEDHLSDQSSTAASGQDTGGNAPTPGPRPGPPSPSALARKVAPRPTAAPEARAPIASDPSEWGRVDESGAVFVRTADGERQVGSWQAGEPAEGLAHFGLRFDDLAAEVALLETRLDTHPQDARKTRASAEALAGQIPEAAAVGDLDSLAARVATVIERSGDVEAEARQRKDEKRTAAIARKEELAAEVVIQDQTLQLLFLS